MTRSDLHKEKYGSKNQLPEDDILDGTSARTRPLSFDDIMLRRKNKGDSAQQISNAHGVADFGAAQDNTATAIDFPESHHQTNYDSEPMDEKNNSNYSHKVRSERKEKTHSSRKNDKLVQVNDEGSLDPDAKSKNRGAKNASSNTVSGQKYERENHGNRKKVVHLSIDSDGPDKSKDRDSYKKDRHSERCRVKSEIVKNQQENEEREVHKKRKPDGRMSSDSDIEYKKRNVKNERQTEKLTSRGREKPEKENRHKRHHEEDKTRGRITAKKNDTEKKGLEPPRTYLEESGPKRRRSRSREREKDRGRRSRSRSPKAYKHISKDGRELGELPPSHSTKDRSGREHSDVDKRISSNGSGSHYRRNTNSSSGLGGYSPRKRKTDAAAKTPSPTRRSPDRRNAGWDFQHAEKESNMSDSTVSYMNTASQSILLNAKELPSVSPVTTTVVKPIGVSLHTLSSQIHAIEAIQLTQATRPMRRLYVENLPASASEDDLKECINKLLLSSGVNYVQGTQPCISSIIHKEKNQALLEFLTPEDASAALSLDGMSFSGSSLKIRRPKDYATVTTGLSDKSVGTVDSVGGIVEDSPNKIFIGGISKLYSSRMLLEIARAFGAVKSFHFEFIADINEPCAFLEYVDHSVTSKACAGLNGMRLGGQVLTAAPATLEPVLENVGKLPIYGIPEHVKPLLEKPTTVVKLKNVLDPESLLSLSESEVEEILQDIKLECSRFGTVKSVNVVKTANSFATMEAHEVKHTSASDDVGNFDLPKSSYTAEQLGETSCGAERVDKSEPLKTPNELENNCQTLEDRNGCDNSSGISDPLSRSIEPKDSLPDEMIGGNIMRDECKPPVNGDDASVNDSLSWENPSGLTGEFNKKQNASGIESNFEMEDKHDAKILSSSEEENSSKIVSFVDEQKEDSNGDKKDSALADIERVFEAGCICVEYRREEAACMAAHCLHGRTFDGRIVSAEYVGRDLYQMRFCG
ncbi:hypothetical protein ACS0TY_027032 [Phlomoides rotata]